MPKINNQFDFFRNVRLDANGAMLVTLSGGTDNNFFVTGATMNSNTLELSRNGGLGLVTADLSQFVDDTNDGVVTGATMNSNTLELSRTQGLGIVTVDLSQFIDDTNDGVVTGATLNQNTLALGRTQGLSDVTVDLSQYATGLTQTFLEFEIGPWNMDITPTVNIPHGLSTEQWKSIRDIEAIVRNDLDTTYYQLVASVGGLTFPNWDATNLNVTRATGFDNADFSATGSTRGWVTILYTP